MRNTDMTKILDSSPSCSVSTWATSLSSSVRCRKLTTWYVDEKKLERGFHWIPLSWPRNPPGLLLYLFNQG